MWNDPIVAELHRIRERHARENGYDLRRIFQDLKQEQASSGRKVVSFSRKRGTAATRSQPSAKN